jgi:hypothetical protein
MARAAALKADLAMLEGADGVREGSGSQAEE